MIEHYIRGFEEELREIRHQIHENPELGLREFKTSTLVAEKLRQWGYEVVQGLATTGVVATLKVGDGEKSIGLRADMDALPIYENSDKPWSSKQPGLMHACGHDGHTTILLGAARYLAETRRFNGTLRLIFQPAEEMINGGEIMVKEGLFDRFPCDVIFGMHNMPGLPVGKFYFQPGALMASMDQFHITVRGCGGHGAIPHKAIDSVVVAAHITTALQSIVARNVDPLEAAVITVGSIVAGEAANVIPDSAEMKISVRSLSRDTRQLLLTRLPALAQAQAASFGATAEVTHVNGTPVLVNDEEMARFAWQVACKTFGEDRAEFGIKPLMGSEDFSFMLEAQPKGAFLLFGNGDVGEGACMVHNPGYDFNDVNLVPASSYWGALVETWLQ
ncbi:M20 aminoacylase family protein [Escherichia albertii]|uniref:M20 aminoacylase family protein n=1 Tax=Escherichia albertii TaxID=208962 RepID=UPI000F669209|nr:M20 aminoacylase family protein [Escherichia albertii]EFF0785263.1 amidohydrolase [Escherichia albertii]EFO1269809.1 amidohydrolase [Escherichia albertii]MCZ8654980.1 M20 family metallopeptidase [Escherichia albertii]MCZ9058607.1 M20 family metallopeptidase [Escherichia albertii]WDB34080.1 M20 family metallopeptidase [Escherichia albertii]